LVSSSLISFLQLWLGRREVLAQLPCIITDRRRASRSLKPGETAYGSLVAFMALLVLGFTVGGE
jgi:hypothetical protein